MLSIYATKKCLTPRTPRKKEITSDAMKRKERKRAATMKYAFTTEFQQTSDEQTQDTTEQTQDATEEDDSTKEIKK